MASFQAKIGLKRLRKRENNNYRSVPFRSYQTRNRKFQKNGKKIQNVKKIPLWPHFKPKQVGKDEREKIKIVVPFHSVPFRSYPTRNRNFPKKSKKIKKN